MGMFDYVEYEATCQKCEADLDDFQSKDAGCMLDIIDPGEVKYFYSCCDKCGEMNTFKVITTAYIVKRLTKEPEDDEN